MPLFIVRASWRQVSHGFAQVEARSAGEAMSVALGFSLSDFDLWDSEASVVRITSVEEVPEDCEEESTVEAAPAVVVLDDDGECD